MNTLQWYMMGLRSVQPANTFIGGVSATISTAALLATKLGISVGAISNFSVVGSDIQCSILVSYTIPAGAFLNNLSITKYLDTNGLVTDVGSQGFEGAKNIKLFEFSGIVTLIVEIHLKSDFLKLMARNSTSIPLFWTVASRFACSDVKPVVAGNGIPTN